MAQDECCRQGTLAILVLSHIFEIESENRSSSPESSKVRAPGRPKSQVGAPRLEKENTAKA